MLIKSPHDDSVATCTSDQFEFPREGYKAKGWTVIDPSTPEHPVGVDMTIVPDGWKPAKAEKAVTK
jgi:hypothetical protein